MINVADNFSYLGQKPLDGRIKYDTLAAMKAMADSTLYDGCLAYCVATDKTYQWKSSNTVDSDTGKWREFTSGGGTGEATMLTGTLLAASWSNNSQTVSVTGMTANTNGVIGITDSTKLEAAQNAQLKITATASGSVTFSCENVPSVDIPFEIMVGGGSSGGGVSRIDYSTSEQDTGLKWIDGKKIYQKTISCGNFNKNVDSNVVHGITGFTQLIKYDLVYEYDGYQISGNFCFGDSAGADEGYLKNSQGVVVGVNATYIYLQNRTFTDSSSNSKPTNVYVTLFYTKST